MLQVLYEDNHLLVVDKPAGLLCQGDRTGDPSLVDLAERWLIEARDKPGRAYVGLVHRLDRAVGGVVLLARTSKAAARLSQQFREGTVDKRYLAVVEGQTVAGGVLDDWLASDFDEARGKHTRVVDAGVSDARRARLTFARQATRGARSLLEVHPQTGRAHQIRVQLAHAGWPIVGDTRYGALAALPERRIALFAQRLTVVHPTRREAITFSAEPPASWPWPVGRAS